MTDFFKQIEDRLSGIVEGIFDKTFATPLQPVELAKKITSAIDDNIIVCRGVKSAPNNIKITLTQEAFDDIFVKAPELIEQLKLYVTAYAHSKKYTFLSPVEITILPGERQLISAQHEEKGVDDEDGPVAKPSYLIIVDMESKTQSHMALGFEITIGRSLTSSIVVPSATASRFHADIREIDGHYVLRDLGSANGTTLNREKVTACRIKVGDEIKIANTTIKVI